MAVFFAKNACCRRVGMKAYIKRPFLMIWTSSLKLTMEVTFDLTISALLTFYALAEAGPEIGEFFATPDNLLITMTSFAYTFIIIALPIYGFRTIKNNFEDLGEKQNVLKHWVWTDELKLSNIWATSYNVLFLVRRILTAFILVFLTHLPFFQTQFLLVFATINLAYLVNIRPYSCPRANQMEIINEGFIVLCSHFSAIFLNDAIPGGFKANLGLILIGIAGSSILINMCVTVYDTVVALIDSTRESRIEKTVNRILGRKLQNRRYLTTMSPGKFKNYEKEISLIEAINEVKKWHKDRTWLLKNGIDVE